MEKPTIIIDFDNTIAESSRAAIKYIWDKHLEDYDKYTTPDFDSKKLDWGFGPFIKEEHRTEAIAYMFTQDFFNNLKPVSLGLKNYLESLHREHRLILCTKRPGVSFDMLQQWLINQGLFKFFDNLICLSNFDKSCVAGSIIIDDRYDCVKVGDRKLRILFGDYFYTKEEMFNGFNLDEHKEDYRMAKNWEEVIAVIDSYEREHIIW